MLQPSLTMWWPSQQQGPLLHRTTQQRDAQKWTSLQVERRRSLLLRAPPNRRFVQTRHVFHTGEPAWRLVDSAAPPGHRLPRTSCAATGGASQPRRTPRRAPSRPPRRGEGSPRHSCPSPGSSCSKNHSRSCAKESGSDHRSSRLTRTNGFATSAAIAAREAEDYAAGHEQFHRVLFLQRRPYNRGHLCDGRGVEEDVHRDIELEQLAYPVRDQDERERISSRSKKISVGADVRHVKHVSPSLGDDLLDLVAGLSRERANPNARLQLPVH